MEEFNTAGEVPRIISEHFGVEELKALQEGPRAVKAGTQEVVEDISTQINTGWAMTGFGD